ncbi:MAG: mechanosensitive ion channel, partial [Planctomycetaceae bacterium]|nr:mechanosensitive ion channel [Planctomycetaceae bacterium]
MTRLAVLLLALLSAPLPVAAQADIQQTSSPLAPSDTSGVRATLHSFLAASEQLHALLLERADLSADRKGLLPVTERLMDCLDLSELPNELRETTGLEAAVYLREVLDRIPLPATDDLPDPAASPDSWRVPGTRLRIVRLQSGPWQGEFRFSAETIRRAASFYAVARELPYRTVPPAVTRNFRQLFLTATQRKPQLSADTSSPRSTLALFVSSMNELYGMIHDENSLNHSAPQVQPLIQQIVSCLDDSELPEFSREYRTREAAVCIKEILDRVSIPPVEEIPGAESLQRTDNGAVKLTHWQIPGTRLVIGRMQEGPREGAWLFTTTTVSRAPEIYNQIRLHPYRTDGPGVTAGFYNWWLSTPSSPVMAAIVERLPASFLNRHLGMALWQWLAVLLAVPLCAGLMYLGFRSGWRNRPQGPTAGRLGQLAAILPPLAALLVPLAFRYFVHSVLSIRGQPLYVIIFLANVTLLLALVVVVFGVCVRLAELIAAHSSTVERNSLDGQLIRILGRFVGAGAAVLVLLEGGHYLGIPLTTLLASAGVGGLAVALAGQSMLKGLFGTLTIMLDKPFREGERIRVKGHDGYVEEIGLRSTRIRSFLTSHLIAIPNDQMADSEIENIGRRDTLRRTADLRIPLDTPLA